MNDCLVAVADSTSPKSLNAVARLILQELSSTIDRSSSLLEEYRKATRGDRSVTKTVTKMKTETGAKRRKLAEDERGDDRGVLSFRAVVSF